MFYINLTEPWLGEIPSSRYPTPECLFHPRCRYRHARCSAVAPQLVHLVGEGHLNACHYPELVMTNLASQIRSGVA